MPLTCWMGVVGFHQTRFSRQYSDQRHPQRLVMAAWGCRRAPATSSTDWGRRLASEGLDVHSGCLQGHRPASSWCLPHAEGAGAARVCDPVQRDVVAGAARRGEFREDLADHRGKLVAMAGACRAQHDLLGQRMSINCRQEAHGPRRKGGRRLQEVGEMGGGKKS